MLIVFPYGYNKSYSYAKRLNFILDQEMKYSVTSHVVYQPGGQVAGMPPQSTYTTAMGQLSQPPPNYQSVTLTAKLYSPGTQRQGKSPCQSGNQYEAPHHNFKI